MEMSEIPEELYESYPAMSAKYHADMIEEYVQKRLKSSQARLSEAVKMLEAISNAAFFIGREQEYYMFPVSVMERVDSFLATLGEEK